MCKSFVVTFRNPNSVFKRKQLIAKGRGRKKALIKEIEQNGLEVVNIQRLRPKPGDSPIPLSGRVNITA